MSQSNLLILVILNFVRESIEDDSDFFDSKDTASNETSEFSKVLANIPESPASYKCPLPPLKVKSYKNSPKYFKFQLTNRPVMQKMMVSPVG